MFSYQVPLIFPEGDLSQAVIKQPEYTPKNRDLQLPSSKGHVILSFLCPFTPFQAFELHYWQQPILRCSPKPSSKKIGIPNQQLEFRPLAVMRSTLIATADLQFPSSRMTASSTRIVTWTEMETLSEPGLLTIPTFVS